MRLDVGPFSLEHQTGKPYIINGYQLEPAAWVLRYARGHLTVPSEGAVRADLKSWVAVWPTGIQVTDPLGRRYFQPIGLLRAASRFLAATGAAAATSYLFQRRRKEN